ncbi:MAG TPA: hypothetical protein PK098_10650 [Phycisphaerales bacterium]|nr:hypothetical protein [Phycisphaerales bacterium]
MAAWMMTASTPVSADPPPPPKYRIINLGTLPCPPGVEEEDCSGPSEAYGINNRGEVVGVSQVVVGSTATIRPFIWLPTVNPNYPHFTVPNQLIPALTMTELPGPAGLMAAFDINVNGIVVGSRWTGSKENQGLDAEDPLPPPGVGSSPAYVWNLPNNTHHAVESVENTSGFPSAEAYAVNDEIPPVIAGVTSFFDSESMPPGLYRGFRMVYSGQTSVTVPMLLLPPSSSNTWNTFAYGIGLSGRAVGHGMVVTPANCTAGPESCSGEMECQRGQYWHPTAGILEAAIAFGDVYSHTVGRDENAAGNVIGSSYHNFGPSGLCVEHAAFWPSVTSSPEPLPSLFDPNFPNEQRVTRAWAIAAPFGGGELRAVGADMEVNRAMLWQYIHNGAAWEWEALDLNDVTKGGHVEHCGDEEWFQLWRAYDINDHGWIVGYGFVDEGGGWPGELRAFLMIPLGSDSNCLSDLNFDGRVDVLDLLILLGSWGPCPASGCCLADLNGSGTVDVQDLLILLVNWGLCPNYPEQAVPTLAQSLAAAGLTQQQWNDFQAVMMGDAPARTKATWKCWMENYLMQCVNCPTCPGPDPFAN